MSDEEPSSRALDASAFAIPWAPPCQVGVPATNEVHVWAADLEQQARYTDRWFSSLSADERERAGRFRYGAHSNQYVVTRGLLRDLLGRYLNVQAACVRFTYGPYGKPALGPGGGHVEFNVSHASGLALFALTGGQRVGVDVERVRSDFACAAITERFFSAGERTRLRGLPPEARAQAFFRCWARKEAYLKGRGEGILNGLDRFDATVGDGNTPLIVTSQNGDAGCWTLSDLPAPPCYVAALAIETVTPRITCWRWQPLDHGPRRIIP